MHENNGGANATKGFIHCLSVIFTDCTLICPVFEGMATDYIPDNVKVLSYEDHRSKIRKGLDCYRGIICASYPYVKQHLNDHRYEIIVIDHSFAGAGLTNVFKKAGAKLITIHHNIERDYLRDNRKEHSILYRIPYIYFAKKAERNMLTMSVLNLTLTEKDAVVFRSWPAHGVIHHWGTFDYRPIEEKNFLKRERGLSFVITGSLCFIQSLQPIMEFIQRYWTILRKEYPNATLKIAGRNPSTELQKLCSNNTAITLISNPKDMTKIIQNADYYICPINAGSGQKLRVMDGLKQGLPILCHEVSAAGYEQIAKAGCLFSYHDETSFKSALQAMVHAQICPDKVYDTFRNCFSLEIGTERLRQILLQTNLL